ncbi:MAG: cellulase family glycosylhydrolase, partial [Pseudomonadota bacterium]
GINVHGDGFPFPGNTATMAPIVDRWGFNMVRGNLQAIDPHKDDTFEDQATADDLVKAYSRRKIVVLLEAHDRIGGWFEGADRDRLIAWMTDLATDYRDNPYVWLGVQNEPGAMDSPEKAQTWLETHQDVIDAVRATGFTAPIVVNDWYWGQGSGDQDPEFEAGDSAILSLGPQLIDPQDNLVFDLHVYDQWDTNAYAQLAAFADVALERELAWLVGEFGPRADGSLLEASDAVFLLGQTRGIGHLAWNWYSADEWDLTTSGNGGGHWIEFDQAGRPTNLTAFGQKLWDTNSRP